MPNRNVADMLKALGIEDDFQEGDMITDAIVLARVSNPRFSRATFYFGASPGMDVIIRLGLLAAGNDLEGSREWESPNEE